MGDLIALQDHLARRAAAKDADAPSVGTTLTFKAVGGGRVRFTITSDTDVLEMEFSEEEIATVVAAITLTADKSRRMPTP